MNAERAIYLDSSAIVKLVVAETESAALRRYLRRRAPLVLSRVDLIRVSDRILLDAGSLLPAQLRSLDSIHLATMRQLGGSLRRVVTYDSRLAAAVSAMGMTTVAPA